MDDKEFVVWMDRRLHDRFNVHLSTYGYSQATMLAKTFGVSEAKYAVIAACDQYSEPVKAMSMIPKICEKRRLVRKLLIFPEEAH